MTSPDTPPPIPGAGYEFSTVEKIGQRVAFGCFTTAAGSAGGFMLGTMLAKAVGSARNCAPAEGLPACDYWMFALPAAAAGFVLVPAITLWRMRFSKRDDDSQ
jgi:hypothetical protein